ncbi:ornithine cyclodeaminase [Geodermatophilus sp. DF01-2]|uniref:ornithine cyclodeaminase n=1 Tax=Geodermatophilus sp. DF01-2 TaxID=2559610 RepID=UPI001072FA3E|nr:ornithine cyclodeaminase [Geodermatophilus sp. DF01_2]TFV56079.1 ornithine cyclodeaminase [Geodermatophilus sp. DF01_2]
MTAATTTETAPVRLLDGDDVDALATVPVGLAAAEDAARLVTAGRITTGRVQVNGPVAWMRILAGTISDLDLLGYKEFHRVGQRVRYHVHLFRESTGDALGIVDGRRITSLRTSATAAAAVRHWAGDAPVRVGLIGSGEESREGLRAIAGAVPVHEAAVFSPTPANRAAFAQQMTAELGVSVEDVPSQAEAIAGCDVLYVATSSHHNAFLHAADVAEVGLVAAIGSTQPVHRELFGDVFTAADSVVVDTPDATHESGDCLEAVAAGWDAGSVELLGNYLATPAGDRSRRTVFKSIGSVEQDLVLAYHLLRAAEEQERGTVVDPVGSLRVMR